ncbi:hypothetical protein SAMN02745121_03787 [Nannocystis exedens]|uniref:Tetratricopeptide repeat-containing protein n=1 Tax=Nannocystis exedens TaxID=54 RepID=A0A1I1ZED2_9BACT|nr:hypothetical protein [Nannocystis exedens]PCC75006.1 hypothetical protein NAEX_08109 [Nannocystis exedens]SFE30164.1 hypothetical protein SAMN02745121_03787 [Nannocystis exedens]
MQLSRRPLHGLCVVLAASLIAPPVAAKPAKKQAAPAGTASTSRPIDPDMPDAGDEAIPDAPLEEGQVAPGARATSGSGPKNSSGITMSRKPNVGSDTLALQFDAEASARFDEGNYREAARLWVKALDALSENETNHAIRSAMLLNAVTAYEQLYVETGEVDMLKRGQLIIADYLKACKKRYGSACDRYPETMDARKRLEEVMKRIDEAQPKIKKIPPEIDTAPGGRPYNREITQPAAPAWIGAAFAVGVVAGGGGAALIYWSRTHEFKKSSSELAAEGAAESALIGFRDEGDTGDTGDTGTDTGDMGTDTGTTGTAATQIELSSKVRADIALAAGVFLAAAGLGLIILGSVKLAKHRRINRERASVLSVFPALTPGGGGLGLSGRF